MSPGVNRFAQPPGVEDRLAAIRALLVAKTAADELSMAAKGRVNGISSANGAQAGSKAKKVAAIVEIDAETRYLVVPLDAHDRARERQLISACQQSADDRHGSRNDEKQVAE
jgi:hypothetical protein